MTNANNQKFLGSNDGTLHFVTLLGLESKVSSRKVGETYVKCAKTVGVRLKTDRAIDVPVIDVLKNKDTGISPEDITSRKVKAKETFDLNMYELMFLITRPEYSGFLTYRGNTQGVYFSPKMNPYKQGKTLLPTPALIFKPGTGSIKANMLSIDKKVKGKWVMKPEFKDAFGALLSEKKEKKGKETSSPLLTAVALNDILNVG